ncbi:hypothetical protein F5Y10DRAFT_293264 [Nemania abortiva]|nr:hypothetical protein F5Y10DRAFT_293264 [Nemania abortiva]
MDGLANKLTTYKQYKEDTESIAGWLARNATRCGYRVADVLPSTSTGRLKGKARKQARDAVKAKANSGEPAKDKPQYTINVSDFTLMAGAIASFKPAVKIPTALDNLFRRAIEARQLFSDWYSQHAQDEHRSNQRHSYFTNILTNTWEILRPFEQVRTSRASGHRHRHRHRPQTGQPDEPSVRLANRFSGLHVETSSEQDTAPETAAQPDESDYVLENVVPVAIIKSEEDIEDDFFLAIHSFLLDLHELRDSLRYGYWPAYCEQGGNELILTALVANTAIQLVRRAEQQLDLLIERPKKYPFPVHNFPAIMMHATHKGLSNKSIKEFVKPSNECHFSTCEHADLLFWDIYQALQSALWVSGSSRLSVAKPDDDPNAPEAFRRVCKLLPCFQTVAATMSEAFASDEVTSAIGYIFETKTIPIWTLFACQVLLDVQDATDEVEDPALQNLKWHTQQVSKSFESLDLQAIDYAMEPKEIQWMQEVVRMYELDVLEDNFRKGGIVGNLKAIRYKGKKLRINSVDDIPPDYEMPNFMKEPDFYLRNNPIKCGMLQYGIYLQTHNFGHKIEYTWRGVVAMIHLYAACRSLYPDDPVWPDMEYFLHHQNIDALFSGGLPKSMEEAMRKALLAMGLAPSNFARVRQKVKAQGPSGVARGCLADLRSTDIKWDKGRPVTNPCLLDKIFRGWMADPKTLAEKARQRDVGAEELKHFDISPEDSDNPGALMRSLLGRLSFVVKSEMGSLLFDTMSFAKTCRTLWYRIRAAADAFYGKGSTNSIFDALVVMLDEARQLQWLAEDLNSPDAASFVRNNAFGLPGSWALIQEMNKKVDQVEPSNGTKFSGLKTWLGDREINRVMMPTFFSLCPYPAFDRLKFRLYKGWREEDTRQSLFVYSDYTREFLRKKREEEDARSRAKDEVAAEEPLPNGK